MQADLKTRQARRKALLKHLGYKLLWLPSVLILSAVGIYVSLHWPKIAQGQCFRRMSESATYKVDRYDLYPSRYFVSVLELKQALGSPVYPGQGFIVPQSELESDSEVVEIPCP